MPLDRPTILAAALELVDEQGLDFTLRSLGERLGVSSMAAYRHFEDKSAIIDALADEILGQARVEDPSSVSDPDELILGYAIRARKALLEHPALVPVIAARPLATESRADDLIMLNAAFRYAGFPEESIPRTVLALVSTTLGLVLYEQQRRAYDRARGPSYQEDREALLDEMVVRDDAPVSGEELMRFVVEGSWSDGIFEDTIRDCYDGLKRRAGIGD